MNNISGQAWGLDLIIASTIFFVGFLTFYLYMINLSPEEDLPTKLKINGENAAQVLLSEGYPINWTPFSVNQPGILSNRKVNETKLESLLNLTQNNYENTKSLLGLEYDFYLSFSENMTLHGNITSGIGKLPQNNTILVRIKRLTVYNNKPTNVYLDIWK